MRSDGLFDIRKNDGEPARSPFPRKRVFSLPATPPLVGIEFGPMQPCGQELIAFHRGCVVSRSWRPRIYRSEDRGQDRKVKRLLLHVFAERCLGDDFLTRQADG